MELYLGLLVFVPQQEVGLDLKLIVLVLGLVLILKVKVELKPWIWG